jgi:hypothetical protein
MNVSCDDAEQQQQQRAQILGVRNRATRGLIKQGEVGFGYWGAGVLALVLVGTAAGGAGGADAVLEGSSRTQLTYLLATRTSGRRACN